MCQVDQDQTSTAKGVTKAQFVDFYVNKILDLKKVPFWFLASHSYLIVVTTVDEITYPFPNFNGCTIEILEWISDFIPYIIMTVITYPC